MPAETQPSRPPDDVGRDDDAVLEWVKVAARAAASKTEAETLVLDVGAVLSIVNWFVITSGRNSRLVKTLADEVIEQVRESGGPKPIRVEGIDSLQWVLLDYGDFVVHVFHDESRAFYDLERLWGDVPRVNWGQSAPDS